MKTGIKFLNVNTCFFIIGKFFFLHDIKIQSNKISMKFYCSYSMSFSVFENPSAHIIDDEYVTKLNLSNNNPRLNSNKVYVDI